MQGGGHQGSGQRADEGSQHGRVGVGAALGGEGGAPVQSQANGRHLLVVARLLQQPLLPQTASAEQHVRQPPELLGNGHLRPAQLGRRVLAEGVLAHRTRTAHELLQTHAAAGPLEGAVHQHVHVGQLVHAQHQQVVQAIFAGVELLGRLPPHPQRDHHFAALSGQQQALAATHSHPPLGQHALGVPQLGLQVPRQYAAALVRHSQRALLLALEQQSVHSDAQPADLRHGLLSGQAAQRVPELLEHLALPTLLHALQRARERCEHWLVIGRVQRCAVVLQQANAARRLSPPQHTVTPGRRAQLLLGPGVVPVGVRLVLVGGREAQQAFLEALQHAALATFADELVKSSQLLQLAALHQCDDLLGGQVVPQAVVQVAQPEHHLVAQDVQLAVAVQARPQPGHHQLVCQVVRRVFAGAAVAGGEQGPLHDVAVVGVATSHILLMSRQVRAYEAH
mmetsp:Transcript_12558/g.17236  ORF Transcript_12558/g.17236 Transcript_12558/m.17236 type:complete len:452 (+) Transcript_12558:545-1900(+)